MDDFYDCATKTRDTLVRVQTRGHDSDEYHDGLRSTHRPLQVLQQAHKGPL